MAQKFSQDQLNRIMDQGVVRLCQCPSLLTRLLSDTRFLHEYQSSCLEESQTEQLVHAAIARATERVSAILEQSLIEVMLLEGWEVDAQGEPKMPARLLELQINAIEDVMGQRHSQA
ncbi:hypothetical protein [Azonexus sp.]|uniref:hypothetical protein n=1 Tax=Azonexus sp. TaxID=1872668 RepID=UPI0035B3F709